MTYIARRFRYLYTGEATAAVLFIGLSILIDVTYEGVSLYKSAVFIGAFILLEVLLAQGVYYWYEKYKSDVARTRISLTALRALRRWQRINWILIGLVAVLLMVDIGRVSVATYVLSVGVYFFAVLEYINYFHLQLSYDNRADVQYLWQHRKLKVASLRRDFQRLKGE